MTKWKRLIWREERRLLEAYSDLFDGHARPVREPLIEPLQIIEEQV